MKDYQILLEKFWNGSASEAEKLQLYKVIVEDEAFLKAAMQKDFDKGANTSIQPETSKRVLESLHKEIGIRASKAIEMPRKSWNLYKSAAAVLLIAFTSLFSWKMYTNRHAVSDQKMTASSIKVISNNTGGVQNLVLNDGTAIKLYPDGELSFHQPFNSQNIRSITLRGKADFKVKHNAARPFEVIANNIKTTDIGTEFCIDASDKNTFKVVLKEGSIKVAAMPGCGFTMDEKVLKPGEVFYWDLIKRTATLAVNSKENVASTLAQNKAERPKELLVFDKTPLNKVFARLQTREQVPIKFEEGDINALTFTGAIEPSDNIETALNIICNLNGLYYHKSKQVYIVAKHQ